MDPLSAYAVVLQRPHRLSIDRLALTQPGAADVVVDIEWSAISSGTERLLWEGRMPDFPGMGYPLVPGYESVGRVAQAGPESGASVGQRVFVPGAKCFGDVRGLFGGAASRVVLPAARTLPIAESLGERGVLLALAATAHHVAGGAGRSHPDLIVRPRRARPLLARLAVAAGRSPVGLGNESGPREGALGYAVVDPSRTRAATTARSATRAATRPARHADRPSPRRRDRPLPASTTSRLTRLGARVHARGTAARRGAMAARRPPRVRDLAESAPCRSTAS